MSTVEKAKEVVADSRFPPIGRRGFGSPFTHAIWGVTASDYLESANRDILVIVQIENREAVENVHAIAAVDGIGQLFSFFFSYFEIDAINHSYLTDWLNDCRCLVHWTLWSIHFTWLSSTVPWSASWSGESDTKNIKSRSWISEEVVSFCVLQALSMGFEYLFH